MSDAGREGGNWSTAAAPPRHRLNIVEPMTYNPPMHCGLRRQRRVSSGCGLGSEVNLRSITANISSEDNYIIIHYI